MKQEVAEMFRALHGGDDPLLLANAWDAGSARLIESLGAKAIATTSAGVAWSHGYADGNTIPAGLVVATVREIARAVSVPITVDIEGGYGLGADEVEQSVAAVLSAGAVGINIEDGQGSPDQLCAKIAAARRAGERLGIPVYINARTDVYLAQLVAEERRVEETLARTKKYREAGADGIFVPAVVKAEEIRTIAEGAGIPLNVLAWPGLPPLPELKALGVKRLSSGSGITQRIYGRIAALASGFFAAGALETASTDHTYAGINQLFRQ